jgi:hypothetical protein
VTDNITTQPDKPKDSPDVISYKELRIAIGVIGVALPILLAVGGVIIRLNGWSAVWFQPSMSAYYYTGMGNVFVGSLCAIGVFMGSYRGYETKDRIAGWIACVCAIGVALFPENQLGFTYPRLIIGYFHYFFAATLFVMLSYFCISLFTKTKSVKTMTPQKKWRNTVYRICGWTIRLCIVAMGVNKLWEFINGSASSIDPGSGFQLIFCLEALAVWMFGISWLVKAEVVLADQ